MLHEWTGIGRLRNLVRLITRKKLDGMFERTIPCGPYAVTSCAPGDLSAPEIERCVSIITSGEAVDPQSAARELPRASALVVVRTKGEIVGVGAIKRIRIGYAEGVAQKSGFTFGRSTPELGYVAIDDKHRGKRLSHRIVAALLTEHVGPLFATTDDEHMKRTLAAAGFIRKGHEWRGNRRELSLWLKD